MNTPSAFSLSYPAGRLFPYTVQIDDKYYDIDPCVRNILRIMRLLKDDSVLEPHKLKLVRSFFYAGDAPAGVMRGLSLFLQNAPGRGGDEDDRKPREKQFDFEFDAPEIYASFVPGMSLEALQALHWYDFLIRLANLPDDSPFFRKIELRFKDLRGYKGKEKSKLAEAKARVQLPEEYSRDELKEMDEFDKEWGAV